LEKGARRPQSSRLRRGFTICHVARRLRPARFFLAKIRRPIRTSRTWKKAPLAKSQRGQVEGGNAQRGDGRKTYRHHRSLGDVATIKGICPAQCEAAHTPQQSAFV